MPKRKRRNKDRRPSGPFWAVSAAIIAGLLIRMFVIDVVRVEGTSMEPAIREKSILLVNRTAYGIVFPFANRYIFRWGSPAPRDVVLYQDPRDGSMKVKRCAEASRTTVFLRGDNAALSLDSRIFGSVPVEKVLGKVVISIER